MCPIDGYEAYNVWVLLALSTSIDILYIDLKLKTDNHKSGNREKENCLNLAAIVAWPDIYWFNLNGKIRKIK